MALLVAAMLRLLERRLGPTPTLTDIFSLVARLRSDHHSTDELDVHPLTTEELIPADAPEHRATPLRPATTRYPP